MKQHQACDHCGGRFGMVTHRWWGNRFCRRTCKDAYLHEVALGRDRLMGWCELVRPATELTPRRRAIARTTPLPAGPTVRPRDDTATLTPARSGQTNCASAVRSLRLSR